ncbi:MAG: glycosyltransferase family 4 protein, partial [Nitrospinales bacterium]
MKICLTVNSSPWSRFKGGGQIAVHHLATALVKKGHDVLVLYSKCPDEVINPSVNYRVHWVRHFNVATVNLNIFSFGWSLRRLARRERFDVIHGNAEEAFFNACVCRMTGAAPFFTSHSPRIPSTGFTGALLQPLDLLKNINFFLLRSAAAGAEQIVTFSRFSKNLVVGGLGQPYADRVEVIAPGIDLTWFEVKRKPSANIDLIFWGRMEDEKGIAELLRAFKNVLEKYPQARLHLVGEGNRLQDYKRMGVEWGIADRV